MAGERISPIFRFSSKRPLRVVAKFLIVVGLLFLPVGAIGASQNPATDQSSRIWFGPDGKPLPFHTEEGIKDFLRTATVIKSKVLSTGINRSRKVLLEKDGIRMNAIFRSMRIKKRKLESRHGVRIDFRDDYIFECASYELSRMLNLNNVPPTVEREIDGKPGSVQAWVENAMTEKDRREKGLKPPRQRRWVLENQIIRLFDNLIFNDDRNQTNVLIGPDWKIWMIDATRAFRVFPQLPNRKSIIHCERSIWNSLLQMNKAQLKERLGGYLNAREINSLWHRRNGVVKHIRKLIDKHGENFVLFDLAEVLS